MTFYKLTNGNYTIGYFLKEENANKENERNNALIKKYIDEGNTQGVDLKPCYIEKVETID